MTSRSRGVNFGNLGSLAGRRAVAFVEKSRQHDIIHPWSEKHAVALQRIDGRYQVARGVRF